MVSFIPDMERFYIMKKIYKLLSVIFGVMLIDQISKGYIIYMLTGRVPLAEDAWSLLPYPYLITEVTGFFNLVFTWNPGTSFSLFRALGQGAPLVIILLTGAIIGFLAHYLFVSAKSNEKLPIALILGGAIGNLIDRCRFGAVVDFLDFHAFGWHWPAFNIADICIVVGVGLYIINIFRKRK